ncbi:MAG: hypothetical protein BEN18_06575 [Epulopiscium sp. Nuni2H_MBin001]|nr:MAG: hypothetical protein BEN18_06575 [Epulopiscium sp. Nuni2H_MBin001]
MKIKLLDARLLILGAVFFVVVFYMTVTSIDLIDENTAYFVSDMQAVDIMAQFSEDIKLLKDTANAVAADKDIISALQSAAEEGGYNDEILNDLNDNINNFIHIMGNLTFVDRIIVTSLDGEFAYSSYSGLLKNFITQEREWFEDSMLDKTYPVIATPYANLTTGEITASIVKVVHDPVTGEPLGCVILNMFMSSLIREIQEAYRIAETDIFIRYDGNVTYSYGGNFVTNVQAEDVDFDVLYKDANFNVILFDDVFESELDVALAVNLDTIKHNEYVSSNSQFVINQIIILTIGIAIVIGVGLVIILRPVFSAISSLIHIIEELGEDYPEYNMGISKVAEMAEFIEQSLPKKIKYLIYYDELTGLPNRKMFKTLYRTFSNKGNPFVVMLLDVRNFKGINDACGDHTGDKVLIQIGEYLNQSVEHTDGTAIRYSGDEFLIIVPINQINNNIGKFYEESILSKFEEPFQYPDKKPILIEFNSAAICNPEQCGNEDDMITKIYVMIKKSKDLNMSQLLLFDNDIYSVYVNEEKIKETLKTAIDSEEFVLNYQPIIDPNKNVVKAEALVRWFSKELGFVPPNQFIYIAEQSRLIIDLSNWIMERVAKDLSSLIATGKTMQISINISPIHIMEETFVDDVTFILNKYNIDYHLICLEITEGVLIEDRDIVKRNIKVLQDLGIHFALDDFGTGYSSFSYLKEYNLDIIKIDKIFVDNASEKEIAIIDGISRISTALGMEMVLEGVETQDQFDNLNKFGLIQGYYFSRPIIWAEFIKLLG